MIGANPGKTHSRRNYSSLVIRPTQPTSTSKIVGSLQSKPSPRENSLRGWVQERERQPNASLRMCTGKTPSPTTWAVRVTDTGRVFSPDGVQKQASHETGAATEGVSTCARGRGLDRWLGWEVSRCGTYLLSRPTPETRRSGNDHPQPEASTHVAGEVVDPKIELNW